MLDNSLVTPDKKGFLPFGRLRRTLRERRVPPFAEQRRIVVKVDELMALCDRLETELITAQKESRHLVEAVLEQAFAPP